MIHQRNVLAFFYFVAAIGAFVLSGIIGSLLVSVIIVAIVGLPITYVIKKIFPAQDWYAYENENSKMTSLNLTAKDKK